MRSIYTKLILGFLLVSFVSVTLVVVVVSIQGRSQFGSFVSGRDRQILLEALGEYYEHNAGWEGVGELLQGDGYYQAISRNLAVADAAGTVVLPNQEYAVGKTLSGHDIEESLLIYNDGILTGYALIEEDEFEEFEEFSLESEFLESLGAAITVSGIAAVIAAVIVGGLLAGAFSRPIRDLTAATRAVAAGELGRQVVVKSKDEIGQLGEAFNQMSENLAKAVRLRERMTADIAHDLRTPLTILRSYSEGLLEGKLDPSQETYQIIQDEVLHLQHLVEDLRTLSLADAGELRLNKKEVSPKDMLERTGLAYARQAEEQGLQLRVDAPIELPPISVDPDRMTQVLNNLVSNALANTEEGEVVLVARMEGDKIILSVRDTGAGISPDDLPNVLNRFFRGDRARSREEDGRSGLGLAIAKAIVEAHGGTIGVESELGEGTTVWVKILLG